MAILNRTLCSVAPQTPVWSGHARSHSLLVSTMPTVRGFVEENNQDRALRG